MAHILQPDPDPTPASAGAPDPSAPPVDPSLASAASEASAGAAFADSVNKLVEQINAGVLKMEDAATRVQPTPGAAPPADPSLMSRVEGIFTEHPELKDFTQAVLAPAFQTMIAKEATKERREIRKDVHLGALFMKHEQTVDAYIKKHQIGDAYLAEHGFEDLLKIVDPVGYVEATRPASAPPARPNAPVAPASAPRTEGVHVGVVGSPSRPAPTVEDAIKATETTAAEEEIARTRFGMKPLELKKQRYEIKTWKEKLGEDFVALNGVPICDLQERMPRNGKGEYIVHLEEL